MIIVSGTNSKKINDPVFLSARKFMQDRLAKLEAQGPSAELDLEKARYTGLTAKDVQIEPPVTFTNDNNIVRCCFVSRKTGFFRADIEVEHVEIDAIFAEFNVTVTEYTDQDTMVAKIRSGEQVAGVVYIRDVARYGLVLSQADATPEYIMALMGDIYWDRIVANPTDDENPTTVPNGTWSVEAINIDKTEGDLYFIEAASA